jgi:hypothetical protein
MMGAPLSASGSQPRHTTSLGDVVINLSDVHRNFSVLHILRQVLKHTNLYTNVIVYGHAVS